MAGITIRRAGPDDAERLNAALAHLSKDIGDDHGGTAALLREAGFGDNPAFRALLAEAGEEIVGAALYSPVFSTVRAGAGVYVSDLWVSETTRGKGLGQRLLRAVAYDADAVWNARFLKLVVYDDNERARSFYDRLGFAASTGETTLTLDADGLANLKGK
ncbi:GNAT family N-acetyltransferase [Oricola sp.]|uniref:GNAT family N-acetyltransferase n=1 Tax=Oricola sp. TaxID=1979950 RepID=UPI0025D24D7A|nr:GNAT family N-acetyltransferase [Oricola sp.]MCI5078058.1 GNAT family N-acetyltransferase [Oricola sp.]